MMPVDWHGGTQPDGALHMCCSARCPSDSVAVTHNHCNAKGFHVSAMVGVDCVQVRFVFACAFRVQCFFLRGQQV